MSAGTVAYPGLILGPRSQYTAGPGTHVEGDEVIASLSGLSTITANPGSNPTTGVSRPPKPSSSRAPLVVASRAIATSNRLPAVHDTVLARVTRVQAQQIAVTVQVVGGAVCADGFAAVVRREDVRGWEADRVVMAEAFRVGDVLRAVVLSLGDQASYALGTARNELGVLLARSERGTAMVPVSWKEFCDPVTGRLEARKVAKPI